MRLDEYTQYDAIGLGELVRAGEVSPSELATACLQAVEHINPALNAVIETFPERAESPGHRPSTHAPFAGVPFLIKDIGATERGTRCEFGSRLAAGYVAPADSDLTRQWRAAGLIILGRTPIPELGFSCTTESVLYGPTRNPWDTTRMTGGSSGGAAAAVASGIVPIAHANDAGGSIRNPSSCCGLVGLKPSRGRTTAGPAAADMQCGLAIEHAVSRTLRDSAALLDATQGRGVGDPYTIDAPSRPYREELDAEPGRLRIAFTTENWTGDPVDAEYRSRVEETAELCESLGHQVEQARPEFDGEALARANIQVKAASNAVLIDELAAATGRVPSEETMETAILDAWRVGKALSATDFLAAQAVFNTVTRVVGQFFERHDVLLTPTTALPAQPLGTYNSNVPGMDIYEWGQHMYSFAAFTLIYNVTGLPAISLPLHMHSAGVPIGVQFGARFGGEATLLRLAAQLETACPWSDRKPAVWAGNY